MGTKQRAGNKVNNRVGFKLGFVLIFLSRSPVPVPRSPFPILVTSTRAHLVHYEKRQASKWKNEYNWFLAFDFLETSLFFQVSIL